MVALAVEGRGSCLFVIVYARFQLPEVESDTHLCNPAVV